MVEVHFSQSTLEMFLRTELSRRENADIVRHLLAQCPICQDTLAAAAFRQGFEVPQQPGEVLPIAVGLG